MGKDGARPELPGLRRGRVDRDTGDVGREQVRVALDPGEASADGDRDRLGQHRLAHTRHILDEKVSRCQHCSRRRDDGARRAEDHGVQIRLERRRQLKGIVERRVHGGLPNKVIGRHG